MTPPQMTAAPATMRQQSPLYNAEKFWSLTPSAGAATAGQQPTVDSSNALGSLVELLGPTPAEREARERRLTEHKGRMQGWAALFDGLRQLGNLYYTTKGATPQKYNDNPYAQIEQQYQAERLRLNDAENYRRQYALQLYQLQRQGATDALAERRMQRQEQETRIRAEKNTAYINYQNALADTNTEQAAYWKAKADALEAGKTLEEALKQATIAQRQARARLDNVRANNGGGSNNYEYSKTTWIDDNGKKHEERVIPNGGQGKKSNPMGGNEKKGNPMYN